MEKRMKRRDFLRLSALATAGAALAACAPKVVKETVVVEKPVEKVVKETVIVEGTPKVVEKVVTAPPAPAEGVTVTWWYAWGNLDPAIEKIIETKEFKAMMGNNKLEYKGSVSSEVILTAVAAGTPPDGGSNFDYPNLWARGAVLPVNEWVESSSIIDPSEVPEAVWQSAFYDGKMIGVPGLESFLWWGLDYNSKAAEDAGLDPDNPPLTWEECLDWHKKLTKFDDAGNLVQMGLDPYDAMAGEPDFAATSWGFKWWDNETKTFNLNDPRMAEALEMCGEFIRFVGPDKFQAMRQVEGQGTWGGAYNAGVQTMIIEGYWHPGETQIQKPEIAQYNRATWAPVPESRKGHKIEATGLHYVQLFKDGKHPDEMFKVAEFLWTDLSHDSGRNPGSAKWTQIPTQV